MLIFFAKIIAKVQFNLEFQLIAFFILLFNIKATSQKNSIHPLLISENHYMTNRRNLKIKILMTFNLLFGATRRHSTKISLLLNNILEASYSLNFLANI